MKSLFFVGITAMMATACSGRDGAAGANGVAGAQGDRGDEGPTGPRGDAGDKGPSGDAGVPGTTPAALTLATPDRVFPARTTTVQIAGVGTHFNPTTTIDFGDAQVKAKSIAAGSSANLRVDVEIGATARLGLHDVTVTTGSETLKLSGGLSVDASVSNDPTSSAASAAQGAPLDVALSNLDVVEHPFGARALRLDGGAFLWMRAATSDGGALRGVAIVDALAPIGKLPLTVSGADAFGAITTYVADPADPDAPAATARSATPLVDGTALDGQSLLTEGASNLYASTTTADDRVLLVTLDALGAKAQTDASRPIGAFAPSSGKFSEGGALDTTSNGARASALALVPTAGTTFLTLFAKDLSGDSDHGYRIRVDALAATKSSMAEPATADSASTPMLDVPLDAALYATDGRIDTDADEDFVLVEPARDGTLHVAIQSNDAPLYAAILGADCKTFVAATVPPYPTHAALEAAAHGGTKLCIEVAYASVGAKTAYALDAALGP